MIVAMNFSSKSQKLNSKKDSTDRFPNTSTESLLSNKKKLGRSKSHVTPSPQKVSRSNDTPNSKTKHQIAVAGLKNVPADIKKKIIAV